VSPGTINFVIRKIPFYPLAIASNLFSITALLIFFGVTGNVELSADIAVVQGAMLTIFLAFSGNARNILLSSSSNISLAQLGRFRLLLVLPFGLFVYFFCLSIFDVQIFITCALIVRRCSEWLAELIISEKEQKGCYSYGRNYLLLQIISLSTLLLHNVVSENFYELIFCFWAVTPVLLGGGRLLHFLRRADKEKYLPGIEYVFHLGSSWVIATTTFVFRVMVIALTSKAIGGELFTAFAIGGMLSSIYTYVVGPSLILKETRKTRRILYSVLFSCAASGVAIILLSDAISKIIGNSVLFCQALGFSMLGSAIMIVSQRKRIILLQLKQESVFVPDVLSNLLIVAVVPLIYYIAGPSVLSALFLCSACLTYLFYSLPIEVKKGYSFERS